MSYNIKQITNYDIKDNPITTQRVRIPTRVKEDGEWKIMLTVEDIDYITAIENTNIVKFGYNCEASAILYPIFLQINGEYKEFQVGKNGMYEFQPEFFKNINEPNAEEEHIVVPVTGIRVPAGYKLNIDYVIPV